MALCFLQITAITLILHAIPLAKANDAGDNDANGKCLSRSPTITDCKQFDQCCIDECVTNKDLTMSVCALNITRSDWSCICGATIKEVAGLVGGVMGMALGAFIAMIVGCIVLLVLCIGGIICCIWCCVRNPRREGIVVAPAGQQVQYNAQYKSYP